MLIWNPLAGAAGIGQTRSAARVGFDLLDDWTAHKAFASIATEVAEAYKKLFARCEVVTANSEATLDLAHRFGRRDAVLIRNGCDPTRFDSVVDPHEPFTVGYGGKIGHRLDTDLVTEAASRFPRWRFEFTGPILERETRKALRCLPNVHFTGDVPYSDYPHALRRWDIAWVPHHTGIGEVGGDVMKIYEYRAAGLPVVIPKIIGWERALPGVVVRDRQEICSALGQIAGSGKPMQVPRDDYETPASHTWPFKARQLLRLLGIGGD